ncbi:MAG TPA: EamA family transporter, partial [Alkalispirochaeta sp.]|nr:EamA family transporter [Alkalispirochaeta sp.]
MTAVAIFLVVFSSLVHAGWNVLSKRSSADGAYYTVAAMAGFIAMVPLIGLWRETFLNMPPKVWLYLVPTGLFQGIYFAGLSGAYRTGEMSVAYPVARAVPVLLVPLAAILVGTGEIPGPAAAIGMVLVAAGLLAVSGRRRKSSWAPTGAGMLRWVPFAVLAGVGTTGYSIVDDAALAAFRSAMATPTLPDRVLSVEIPLIYSGF